MKRLAYLLCWFLTGFSMQATAGNILGAELTYATIAPNLYVISFNQIRDCAAGMPSGTYSLQLNAAGCNPGRTVVLNQMGLGRLVADYCPKNANLCAPFNQPGIAVAYYYTSIVTFTAAETACADWTMSLTIHDDNRSASANVVGTPSLYLEAYLNLSTNINNSSPSFSNSLQPYTKVVVNQNVNYNLNVAEPDGDSLVYSLVASQQAPATAVTYQPIFSAQNPVISNPAAVFNTGYGSLQFRPTVFVANTLPAQGANRYVAKFQIDEYRKINGIATKIGSVQRDMIFEIKEPDTVTNHAPFFKNFNANGQPFNNKLPLKIPAGKTLTVNLDTDDPDLTDSLMLGGLQNLPGFATATILNNGAKPQLEILFTPTVNDIQVNPYILPMQLEDNACPVKSIIRDTLIIEITSISGSKPDFTNVEFSAFPNPFTSVVSFRFNQESEARIIIIYNLLGQQIDRISLKNAGMGEQHIQWPNASQHAAGTYIAKLISTDKTVQTLKFTKLQ